MKRSYPLAQKGTILGVPGAGTHSYGAPPNNWQSDRAYDLKVPIGTPVLAIWDGVIGKRIGSLGGPGSRFGGIRVYLEVWNKGKLTNEYYYAHLSKLAAGVKPGKKVQAGQVIGFSGSASNVPHLHVAVKVGSPKLKLLGGVLGPLRHFAARNVPTDLHDPIKETS